MFTQDGTYGKELLWSILANFLGMTILMVSLVRGRQLTEEERHQRCKQACDKFQKFKQHVAEKASIQLQEFGVKCTIPTQDLGSLCKKASAK